MRFVLAGWHAWHAVMFARTRLLRRKFAERLSSPDARSDVNYRAFLAAVDLAMAGHNTVSYDSALSCLVETAPQNDFIPCVY